MRPTTPRTRQCFNKNKTLFVENKEKLFSFSCHLFVFGHNCQIMVPYMLRVTFSHHGTQC